MAQGFALAFLLSKRRGVEELAKIPSGAVFQNILEVAWHPVCNPMVIDNTGCLTLSELREISA